MDIRALVYCPLAKAVLPDKIDRMILYHLGKNARMSSSEIAEKLHNVGFFFHPVNDLAIELLLDRDMSHSGCGSGSMPMLFTGRKPDYISRPNFLDGLAIALNPATPSRDNQSLVQWMRVPCSACAGFERNAGTLNTCWGRCLKKWIDPYSVSEPVRWPLTRSLRSNSSNFHFGFP